MSYSKDNCLIKYGYSSDLKRWQIFSFLQPQFISQIYMIMAFDDDAALIVTKDKMVYGLGVNKNGRLGINDETDIFQPKKVEALCGKNIKTFCCNSNCGPIFALTEEGKIYAWAFDDNQLGYILRLGLESSKKIYMPSVVNINDECIDIACSFDHTIALTNDGNIYTWGNDKYKQIFECEVYSLVQEIIFNHLSQKIIYIACGKLFNVVITSNGKVYSWGANDCGQLGLGYYVTETAPCLINSLMDVTIVKVVCGVAHTLALTTEGELYFWGKNTNRQFIDGRETETETVPIKLNMSKIGKVSDIATQDSLLLAIDENGSVYAWGRYFNLKIMNPTVIQFSNVYDIFKYNWPYIIHNPLIDHTEEKSNILKCLGTAFNDLSTSDLTIQIKEQFIHVHKAVLKIRSQYYRSMFQHNWEENNQNIITHNQFSYIVYKAFLEYLYTGIINLPSEKTLELLKLADAYGETNLKKDCVQLMRGSVIVSNVAMVYMKAIKYNSKELEELCFKFALDHLTDVVQTENFISLNENMKTDFIIKAAKAGAFKN